MIDYTTKTRPNQLLGGLTAAALLWQGRQTDVDFTISEKGIVTGICVVYAMPQDEYRIHATLTATKNGTILYRLWAEWEGQTIKTVYLPDDVTEESFTTAFVLLRKHCRRNATAELITEALQE